MMIGNSHKETIAAYESQLKAAKELLEIQAQEAMRSGEHIVMLNGEVDIVRRALREKQESLLSLQGMLQAKADLVEELHKKLDQSHIDRLAFYTLEKQNEHLLEKLKEKQQRITELEVEVRFLNQRQDDNIFVEDTKAGKLNELEIIGPYERTILSVQLEQSLAKNADLEVKLRALTAELEQTRKAFEWSETTRVDQLARAKQIEFRQLMELGRLDSTFRRLELDTEHLQRANKREQQRGAELQAQLRSSVQTVDRVQQVCGAVIDIVERDDEQLRRREKQLIKQNVHLQAENQLLGAALSHKLRRPRGPASLSPTTKPSKTSGRLASPGTTSVTSTSLPVLTSPSRRAQTTTPAGRRATPLASPRVPRGLSLTAPPASSTRGGSPLTRLEVGEESGGGSPLGCLWDLTEAPRGSVSPGDWPDEAALPSPQDILSPEADPLRGQMIDRLCLLYLHSARYVLTAEVAGSFSHGLSEGLPGEDEQFERFAGTDSVDRTASSPSFPSSFSFSSPPSLSAPLSVPHIGTTQAQPPLPSGAFLASLPLQGLQLQSCDIARVVHWLRLVPLRVVEVVDLSANQLGDAGWLDLTAWLLSVPPQELQTRNCPLRIDLRHNRIKGTAIEKGMQLLRSCAEFSLVTLDGEAGQSVLVYGRRPLEDAARKWIAIDMSEQRKRPRSTKTVSVHFKSPIVALSDVMTDSGAVTSADAPAGTSPRPLDGL